jgi:hypothetical protein
MLIAKAKHQPAHVSRLLLVALIAGASSLCLGQSWSYHGSSICYDSGAGATQCYASGIIEQYLNSRDGTNAQFEAGRAVGESASNLITAILSRWSEHRKRVEAERTDLRAQLRAYQAASAELLDELMRQQENLISSWPKFAKYSGSDPSKTEERIRLFREWSSEFAKQKRDSEKNTAIIAAAKDTRFLRENVGVYKRNYETLYRMASGGYVFSEFVEAMVGYYESQESAS